ncbi:hypothetical protein MKX01_036536 [Papaver californicum]|nr:hypothetical protein MKX01_036536 [Papaver californicum]
MVSKRVRDISKLEDKFHKFPGRRTENWTTGLASMWSKKNTKGTNHDAMIFWEDFPSRPGTIVSGMIEDDRISQLKGSFLKAFEDDTPASYDCFDSQHLVIGNVGDSRAVLGTRDQNDSLIAVQLTKELKPNLPGDAKSIRGRRGRVFALKSDVARVWVAKQRCSWPGNVSCFWRFLPQLNLSRTDKDEFGYRWDVVSNKEVVNIVRSAPVEASAARALYPTSKVDDCTAVVHFRDSCTSISISNIQDTTGTTTPGKEEEN